MRKYCPKCETELDTALFGPNKSRSDRLQPACKECMKVYRRAHYHANKQPYLDRARALEAELKILVFEIKKDASCNICGIRYPGEPWLMDFDHRSQEDKEAVIGKFIKSGNKGKLLAEIAKCDILCVVCHRRRTAKQLGWFK